MDCQKFFLGSNIKKLRARKKLNQEQLADKLNMTRSRLTALELRTPKNPSVEDLFALSEFFNISIDTLLKVDLSNISDHQIRELEAGNDIYLKGGNLRVLATSVDKANNENIELVPIKAKAGYIAGFNDPDYISSLPKFQMPILPKNKTYRMFPITGDSMAPFNDGSYVITEYVEDWLSLKTDTLCIIILSGQNDIVFKSIKYIENSAYLFKSYNSQYQPFKVEARDILEIWRYNYYVTKEIFSPRVDLEQIAEKIDFIYDKLVKE